MIFGIPHRGIPGIPFSDRNYMVFRLELLNLEISVVWLKIMHFSRGIPWIPDFRNSSWRNSRNSSKNSRNSSWRNSRNSFFRQEFLKEFRKFLEEFRKFMEEFQTRPRRHLGNGQVTWEIPDILFISFFIPGKYRKFTFYLGQLPGKLSIFY